MSKENLTIYRKRSDQIVKTVFSERSSNGTINQLYSTQNTASATAEWTDPEHAQEVADNTAFSDASTINQKQLIEYLKKNYFPTNSHNYGLAMPSSLYHEHKKKLNSYESKKSNNLRKNTRNKSDSGLSYGTNIAANALMATDNGLLYSNNLKVWYLSTLQPKLDARSIYSNGIPFTSVSASTTNGIATNDTVTYDSTFYPSAVYASTAIYNGLWSVCGVGPPFDPSYCSLVCSTIGSSLTYSMVGTSKSDGYGGVFYESQSIAENAGTEYGYALSSVFDACNNVISWNNIGINCLGNHEEFAIAGTTYGLFFSNNNGKSFTQVASDMVPQSSIVAITMNSDLNALCCTSTAVYYSTGNLYTWSLAEISDPLTGEITSISVDGNYGLLTTDSSQTFESTDYGITWSTYTSGSSLGYNSSNNIVQLNGMGIAGVTNYNYNESGLIQTALYDSSNNTYFWENYTTDLCFNYLNDVSCYFDSLTCQSCACAEDCSYCYVSYESLVSPNSTLCTFNMCNGQTVTIQDGTAVNFYCTCDVSGCDTCNPVQGLGYINCCIGEIDADAQYVAIYNNYMLYNSKNNPGTLFYTQNETGIFAPSTFTDLSADDVSGNTGPLGMYNNIVMWLYLNDAPGQDKNDQRILVSSDYGQTFSTLVILADYGIPYTAAGLAVWGTYFFLTYMSDGDQIAPKVAYGNVFPGGQLNYFKISDTNFSGNSVTYSSGVSTVFSTCLTTNDHAYLVTNENGENFYFYKSTNNGESWVEFLPQSDPSTGTNFELGVTGWSSDFVLLSQSGSSESSDIPFISYTNNAGSSWNTSQISTSYILQDSSYFTAVQQNDNYAIASIVVSEGQATIVFSDDYGYSFKQSYDASFNPMTFYSVLSLGISGKYAIAGVETSSNNYTVYLSINYGYTWYIAGQVPKIVPQPPKDALGLANVLSVSDDGNGYEITNINTVSATSYEATSDYRIKSHISDMDESFSLNKLNPVIYFNKLINKKDIGLIAHELAEVYPFLVNGEKDGQNYQSINYNALLAILVKNVQLLKDRFSNKSSAKSTHNSSSNHNSNPIKYIDDKNQPKNLARTTVQFDCSRPGLGLVLANSGDGGNFNITDVSTMQAVSFTATSDYRVKKNVQKLSHKHSVDKLNPVSYFNKKTRQFEIGFIAHEVQSLFPFLVNGEKDGDSHQAINYTAIIPILIKEIQQLDELIRSYENKNNYIYNYNHKINVRNYDNNQHKSLNNTKNVSNQNVIYVDASCNLLTLNDVLTINDSAGSYDMMNIGTMSAVSYTATSDYRIKRDIKTLDDSFNIDNIRPVTYINKKTNKFDTGFIAHELQDDYSYLVTGTKDANKYQTVKYNGIIALLTHEIKQLKNTLKSKI